MVLNLVVRLLVVMRLGLNFVLMCFSYGIVVALFACLFVFVCYFDFGVIFVLGCLCYTWCCNRLELVYADWVAVIL